MSIYFRLHDPVIEFPTIFKSNFDLIKMEIVLGKLLNDQIYQLDRSDVDYFLNINFLPSDLRDMDSRCQHIRKEYPFAWVSKDLPRVWIDRAKETYYPTPHPLYLFVRKSEISDADNTSEVLL